MAFQERNGICGMKLERSGRNLAEKSRTDRDLKWDENCSVLFHFWIGMECFGHSGRNRTELTTLILADLSQQLTRSNFPLPVLVLHKKLIKGMHKPHQILNLKSDLLITVWSGLVFCITIRDCFFNLIVDPIKIFYNVLGSRLSYM